MQAIYRAFPAASSMKRHGPAHGTRPAGRTFVMGGVAAGASQGFTGGEKGIGAPTRPKLRSDPLKFNEN
jgi:hypothetical protein